MEKDIILKHMWPLTIIPPRYLESFIVSIIDKIVATGEFAGTLKDRIPGKSEKNRSSASETGEIDSPM